MSNNSESDLDFTEKLNTVKRQNTYEIIIEQLQELIFSGEVKPGQKLPGERALAARLGASRTSVRLAIKLLEFMNLLEVRPGAGVWVSSEENLERAAINSKLKHLMIQNPLMDLIEARKCFEPFMASLAAQNAQEDEIDELENLLNSMEEDIKEGKKIINQAVSFHEMIYKASKNIILNQIGLLFHNLSDESKRVSLNKYEYTIESLNQHKKILAAIKEHDAEAASEYMKKHLDSVENHLKNSV